MTLSGLKSQSPGLGMSPRTWTYGCQLYEELDLQVNNLAADSF